MKSSKWKLGLSAVVFFVSVFMAYFVGVKRHEYLISLCRESHLFINTEVLCGEKDVIRKTGYEKTKQDIINYIEERKSNGEVSVASVYFRDLVHGPVLGIDEQLEYAPASQLKLPLAVVFMRLAEEQDSYLNKKIIYKGVTSVSEQRIIPKISAVEGVEYSLEELIRNMLIYSDNASYEALESFLLKDPIRKSFRQTVFQEVGLIDPENRVEDTLTVRGYGSILRLLYNTSYLETASSEKILSWLAESDYKDGIKSSVPTGVIVANKFGERIFSDKTKQLSDCGIVYYPKNPYLICIMTRGNEWNNLTSTISDISKIIYTEVDSRRI